MAPGLLELTSKVFTADDRINVAFSDGLLPLPLVNDKIYNEGVNEFEAQL